VEGSLFPVGIGQESEKQDRDHRDDSGDGLGDGEFPLAVNDQQYGDCGQTDLQGTIVSRQRDPEQHQRSSSGDHRIFLMWRT